MKTVPNISWLLVVALAVVAGCAQPQQQPKVVVAAVDSTMLRQQQPVTLATDTVNVVAMPDTAGLPANPKMDVRFEPLVKRLVADGWPDRWVRAKFADKRTEFLAKMASITPRTTVKHESTSAYAWVNTPVSAAACEQFIANYDTIFTAAEKVYGVDRETIAALLRTETQHGKITGSYHVFSVFATIALLTQPEVLDANIKNARASLPGGKGDSALLREQTAYIRDRSNKKSSWAFRELTNLLKIDRDKKMDVMALRGSWAGAFGWSQFLPSSYITRAVDGNGDHKVDLFNPADAIFSVANYLRHAGYVPGNGGAMRHSLYDYNNSSAYVNSISALAERVRKDQQAKARSSGAIIKKDSARVGATTGPQH